LKKAEGREKGERRGREGGEKRRFLETDGGSGIVSTAVLQRTI
jgi:hypothetical protein